MKKNKKLEKLCLEDEVLIALKERYFKVYARENIGKTPEITKTLDKIQDAINKRIGELKDV